MGNAARIARHVAAIASLVLCTAVTAQQSNYPTHAIRLITPFPPGGVTDILSRIISEKMSESFGQTVVVENKGGAAGMNGTELVARAAPDGYTVVNVISSHSVQPYLYREVPYQMLKDFEPVILYARSALAFVVLPSFPANNVKEYVAYVKASKTPVSYGTSGVGAAVHLTMESFKQAAGLQLEHVPYKGGGPAVQDALGGHVPGVMLGLSTVAPYVKSGKLKMLWVSSAERQPEFPDVPTLQESGFPGLIGDEWWVILAPAGTPKPIVNKLNAEITRIFTLPDVQEKIKKLGVDFIGSTPAGAAEFIQAESVKWGKVIKAANMKPE